MKELLNAIKNQLQSSLTYVRSGDVFPTPSENYLPAHAKFPCVGIKDGDVARTELAGGMLEIRYRVTLCVFVSIPKEAASVMGNSATGGKGALEISDDIHAALDENALSITGMIEAFSPSDGASELFGNEEETIQRKLITYEYVKQEARP